MARVDCTRFGIHASLKYKPYTLNFFHLRKIQTKQRECLSIFLLENQNPTRIDCQVDGDLWKLRSRRHKTVERSGKFGEPGGSCIKDNVLLHVVAVSSVLNAVILGRSARTTKRGKENQN